MSGTSARAHALRAIIIRLCYKDFLKSNQKEREIQSTNRTLSRPTLPIVVTETVVKARGGLRCEIESTEVESGSHRGQTVPLSARTTSRKEPTIAVQLSLALQQVPHFHSR